MMFYISDESLKSSIFYIPLVKSRFLAFPYMLALTVLAVISPAAFSITAFPYEITWKYKDDDNDIYFDFTASVELASCNECASSFPDVDFSYTENFPKLEGRNVSGRAANRKKRYYRIIHSLLTSSEAAVNGCGCMGRREGRNKYTSLSENRNQTYGSNQLLLILHRLLTGQTKERYFDYIVIPELPHGLISGIDYDKNYFTLSDVRVRTVETAPLLDGLPYLIRADLYRSNIYRDTADWTVRVLMNPSDHSYKITISTIDLTNGAIKFKAQAPAWFGVEDVSGFKKLSKSIKPAQRSEKELSPVQRSRRSPLPVQPPEQALPTSSKVNTKV